MIGPLKRGALLRAAIAAVCLGFASHADAAPKHRPVVHHWHHFGAQHHAGYRHTGRARLAAHRRAVVAIDVRTGAIDPAPIPFFGSLFAPPAPPALVFDNAVVQPISRAARNAVRAAVSYGNRGYAAVATVARQMGFPVALALAEAKQESSGNCRAHSPTDARGVLQVEPYTAIKDGFDPRRLYECEYGAVAGITELQHQIEAEGGITCHALSRYYGSDAYVRRFRGGCAPYGREVLARMRAIERSPDLEASLMLADWSPPLHRHHHHHHRRTIANEGYSDESLAA